MPPGICRNRHHGLPGGRAANNYFHAIQLKSGGYLFIIDTGSKDIAYTAAHVFK